MPELVRRSVNPACLIGFSVATA